MAVTIAAGAVGRLEMEEDGEAMTKLADEEGDVEGEAVLRLFVGLGAAAVMAASFTNCVIVCRWVRGSSLSPAS